MVTTKNTNPQTDAPGQADAAEKPSSSSVRIIKKYPNRRLYDTTSSSYITLAEVKQLVIDSKTFAVKDAKTGEDLTRSILLQIILEEELGGMPMFTEPALANMIRFYGHTMQGFMGSMLEKNMQVFMDMQSKLGGAANMPNLPGMGNMSQLMGGFMEQSQSMAAQMQEQMREQMLTAFGVKR